jgi:phage tail tape-measure protein
MAKTHFHSNPQQRWFKPSASTGVRFAQYGATLGTRFGPQGVVIGGAIGVVAGALIGGAWEELDVI